MALVDKYLTLSVSRQSSPPAPTTQTVARVSDVALSGSARSADFESIVDASAALAASEIDQDTYDAIAIAFQQSPRPAKVIIIKVDVTGGESYSDALTDAESQGVSYNGFCIDSRTSANIVIASDWAESRDVLFFFQSADADWLTASVPSGFSSITDNNKTGGIYHATDGDPVDMAYLSNLLAFDTESSFAPGGPRPISGVTPSDITTTQRNAAIANSINVCENWLPNGQGNLGPNVVEGESLTGVRLDALLTEFYIKRAIRDQWSALLTNESAAGRAVTVSTRGQAQAKEILDGMGATLVEAGRLTVSDTYPMGWVVEPGTITTADKTARRVPILAVTYNLAIPALALTVGVRLVE